ncbi:MAG: rRNA processing protein RimM [Streptosporangiaceae bacterium]|nr:rRNA processing protein RimM [Streptosporangiaceae bacterium]
MQLVVGRITRPHGVRGEVSVEVRTDEPDRRFAVGHVLTTDPVAAGPLTVESMRWHSGRLLIQFAGVTDRNQADDLRGIWLTLDSAEAGPSDDPDEFHDAELIGLAVVTTSGEPVGRVTDVRHFGQDLLVIEPGPAGSSPGSQAGSPRAESAPAESAPAESAPAESAASGPVPAGPLAAGGPARRAPGSELLVPFVAAIVPEVDVAAGRLVIDPPPGLLELAAGETGPAGPAPAGPAPTGPAPTGPARNGPAGS